MPRPAVLCCALVLLVAPLSAGSLQFGPNMTFSDPLPGQSAGPYGVVTGWVENGQPVVVIQGSALGSSRTFRARVRSDGTVDTASVIAVLGLIPVTAVNVE